MTSDPELYDCYSYKKRKGWVLRYTIPATSPAEARHRIHLKHNTLEILQAVPSGQPLRKK